MQGFCQAEPLQRVDCLLLVAQLDPKCTTRSKKSNQSALT